MIRSKVLVIGLYCIIKRHVMVCTGISLGACSLRLCLAHITCRQKIANVLKIEQKQTQMLILVDFWTMA